MKQRLLTVEDAFEIEGRGTQVVSRLPLDQFQRPFSVPCELRRPDGRVLKVQARIAAECCHPVGTAWSVCLDVSKAEVPPGTEIWAERIEGAT